MSQPKPGQIREARRAYRLFHNALCGASAWAVAPHADLEALHSAWARLGLEVLA